VTAEKVDESAGAPVQKGAAADTGHPSVVVARCSDTCGIQESVRSGTKGKEGGSGVGETVVREQYVVSVSRPVVALRATKEVKSVKLVSSPDTVS
jgi:hypothetical protein